MPNRDARLAEVNIVSQLTSRSDSRSEFMAVGVGLDLQVSAFLELTMFSSFLRERNP